MPDLLDRIRAELQQRLESSRDAVEEYRRLEAALEALGEQQRAAENSAPAKPAPRRRPARAARAARPRAPRGENRRKVLDAVADRPGVTAPELASVSGIRGGTLYTVLRRLVEEGTLEKRELPGGDTGYTVSEQSES